MYLGKSFSSVKEDVMEGKEAKKKKRKRKVELVKVTAGKLRNDPCASAITWTSFLRRFPLVEVAIRDGTRNKL